MSTTNTGGPGCNLRWITTNLLMAIALLFLGITNSTLAQQSQAQNLSQQDQQLVDNIANTVLQNLLRDGALDDAINRGIQRYIQQQREARASAQRNNQDATNTKAKDVRPVSATRDHIFGNPDAVISLIEYSDFECPFCKRFHPTAKRIVESYAGKVNWVYRHFPLAFHNPGAQTEAEASECAAALGGNDAFWTYADKIYERTRSNGKGFPIQDLVPLAAEIGLNEEDFRSCLKNGQFTARVQEDFEEGVRIGITGTPGNIILNNRSGQAIPRPGAAPFEAIKQIIDRLLKKAS